MTTLVLFDCDGTLVDSIAVIDSAMARAFTRNGLVPPERAAVRRIVGLSLDHAVRWLAGDFGPELLTALVESYKTAWHELRAEQVDEPLFPGTLDVMRALDEAGALMGIVTGKTRRGLDLVLLHHGLERRFVTLQTADLHPSKPHPAMVLAGLAETGIAADRTVVVGDTTFDIEMARAANVRGIGVAWGNHAASDLEAAGADAVLTRFSDLLPLVLR